MPLRCVSCMDSSTNTRVHWHEPSSCWPAHRGTPCSWSAPAARPSCASSRRRVCWCWGCQHILLETSMHHGHLIDPLHQAHSASPATPPHTSTTNPTVSPNHPVRLPCPALSHPFPALLSCCPVLHTQNHSPRPRWLSLTCWASPWCMAGWWTLRTPPQQQCSATSPTTSSWRCCSW